MRRMGPGLLILLLAAAAAWLWMRDDSAPNATAHFKDETTTTETRDAPLLSARTPAASAAVTGAPRLTPPPAHEPAIAAPPTAAEETHYTIQGTVRMQGTGTPVAGGTVVVLQTGLQVVKHVGGSFQLENRPSTEWSAEVDRGGRFSMEIRGTPAPNLTEFRYEAEGLQLERWILVGKEKQAYTDSTPDGTNTVVVTVQEAFRIRGEVVDPAGEPQEGVAISFGRLVRQGSQHEIRTIRSRTGTDGRFDLGPFPEAGPSADGGLRTLFPLSFEKPGYALHRLDPWDLPKTEREQLRVVLDPGATLGGVLLDPWGRALPAVVVSFEVGEDWKTRRAVRTDNAGLWQVERVQRGTVRVRARAFAHGCKVSRNIEVRDDDLRMELVAESVPRPDPSRVKTVLGLSLVDVDDQLRAAYELPKEVNVLILDADETHGRLGIGTLEAGYGLWMVGDSGVKDLKEAIDRLLRLAKPFPGLREGQRRVRVVYTFANERMRGTNTQYLTFDGSERAELERLLEDLDR